jgi:multidrug resistance efflux pump
MDNDVNRKEKEVQAPVELHSRETTDVLGDAPGWLVHTGSYLVYGMLILLLSGSALISYPDAVRGEALIEDLANVDYIKANSGGQIETVFVPNNARVKRGDTIALIQNPARLDDVVKFCRILENVENYYNTRQASLLRKLPFDLVMGEMAGAYENFTQAVMNCLLYNDYNYDSQRRVFLQRELDILKREAEKNELALLKTEREIFELSVSHKKEVEKNVEQLEIAYEEMLNSLRTWESKYLIRSPKDGRIVLGETRELMHRVNIGDTIGSVISSNEEKFTAWMHLEQKQIAGVEPGNPVNIDLAKYPAHTYGHLTGEVSFISFLPYNQQYRVGIDFPDKLYTTAKKEIRYELGLKGEAEIVTSSQSVFSRIFMPLYNHWKAYNKTEKAS